MDNGKSTGPGFFHEWALKTGKYAFGAHLQLNIKDCIQYSGFPSVLKPAQVTPIHKKGPTTQMSNHRPISVIPTLAKQFEKLVHIRMMHYINKNNLLNKKQLGFQYKKMSTDAVLFISEIVFNIENAKKTLQFFIP